MSERRLSTQELIAAAKARLADDPELPEAGLTVPAAREVSGYEEAAALLGWFDPDTLRPAKQATEQELGDLADAATLVIDDHGESQWSLNSSQRVEVLAHLQAHGGLDRAISANRVSDGDLLGRLIRSYATGERVELVGRPLAELFSISLVCDWLRRAGFTDLPDASEVHERIDLLELLEPFVILVGTDFVGRKVELARLDSFLTAKEAKASRTASFGLHAEDPDARMLVIFGPGGIGKSTLIAKALLELADLERPEDQRVLFAYLDFDRPAMDAANDAFPLLCEILAQIAVQHPAAKAAVANIRDAWAWRLERPPAERAGATRHAVDEVATLLSSLGLSSRRLVLVLDTFEMVQRRSSEEVATILRMVDVFVNHKRLPGLRVILAGRAGVPRSYADNLEVAGLDDASAKKLLTRLGMTDRKLRDRIVRRYGGDPLALRLAAANPEAHGALNNLVSRATEWFRQLDESVIQRRLYERVLGHLDDPDVRRLAETGLVLRRLTPGIVLDVLAKPCGLRITTYDDAVHVWEELERETSIVQLDADGSLLPRPELRRLTLPLLEADQPDETQALHRAAVAYYSARPPQARERAEEIYHRLKAREDTASVATRWMRGVEPFLQGAVHEFDGPRRAFLASRLGVPADSRATVEAATDDYEQITARKVRAMLKDDRPKDALTALSARPDRTAQSPLVALTAEAHFALGQVGEAIRVLDDSATEALGSGLADHAYRLSRLEAELVVSAGAWEHRQALQSRLRTLAREAVAPLAGLTCLAFGAALAEHGDPREASSLRHQAWQVFDRLADEQLVADPSLIRIVGSLHVDPVGEDDVLRVSRVIRLAGVPRQLQGPVRVAAAELASLDASASAVYGEAPGMLARRYRVTGSQSSLTAAWSAFLIGADDAESRLALCGILGLRDVDLAPLVVALARLLGNDPALRRPSGPYAGAGPDHIARVPLSPGDRRGLTEALSSIFTPESLRWFLRLRLHQSLDALAPAVVGDFHSSVVRLVERLEERGLLLELVAHAREVAPGDVGLLRAAEVVGLATPLSDGVARVEGRLRAAGLDVTDWTRALGELEGEICRVRVDDDFWGAGFLVGPDLLLTASRLAAGAELRTVQCQFDAQRGREGEVVTPGVWYDVDEVVATAQPRGRPDGWALLRLGGSPGVQPIGGDRVESLTGTLRGWVDISRAESVTAVDQLQCLHPEHHGSLKLTQAQRATGPKTPGPIFQVELAVAEGAVGAPVLGPDLTPVGLVIAPDPEVAGSSVAVTLESVLQDLEEQGLDHLVRVALA